MKKSLFILLLFSFFSCKNEKHSSIRAAEEKNDQLKEEVVELPEKANSTTSFDTIIIDHEIENKKREEFEANYRNLSNQDIIDSLKLLAKYSDVSEFKNAKALFPKFYTENIYYKNNIPNSVYVKLFPEEEIKIDRVINTSPSIDKANKTITIQKGAKVFEEREYPYLYSVIDKGSFIQLHFTKRGKYCPKIELFTVSSHDLKIIDQTNIFAAFRDVGDVDVLQTEIFENYNQIQKTEYKNNKTNYEKIDTIYTKYQISSLGIIEKLN